MTDNHIKDFMTIDEKWWLLARQWMWKIPQASPTRFEASDLPNIRQAPYPLTQLVGQSVWEKWDNEIFQARAEEPLEHSFTRPWSSIPEFQKRSQSVYVWLFIVVVCPIRGQQTSASGRSTYLPGQGDKRITRDWQRFTLNKWCKTSIFFANFPNVLLWYLRMVLRITGEILVDILNNLRWIFCRDWNFLPQVKPLLTA